MKKETIQTILQLLERVNLTGKEVRVFNGVVKELVEEFNKKEVAKEENELRSKSNELATKKYTPKK